MNDDYRFKNSLALTIALVPPEFTNEALASPDCLTAPTKSLGKQLKDNNKSIK